MSTTLIPTTDELESIRRDRYRKAADLIRKWKSEAPEYDERVGKLLEAELQDAAVRCEDRDESSS